jgi:uncharacterized damage-inducible protein DinB
MKDSDWVVPSKLGKNTMNRQDIFTLYRYNQWANEKILSSVKNVTHEQFVADAPFPHGGLRGTLVHTLFAEWIWRNRWEGNSPTDRLKPEEFPTVDALRDRWKYEEQKLMTFVQNVSDEQLNAPFHYNNTKGLPKESILWHSMAHVVNHGTQHRAEAAALLTEFGCSPGDVDMIYFLAP